MLFWIKRVAWISAASTFFIVFAVNLDLHDLLNIRVFTIGFIKATAGASLFWLAGFIIGDVLIKGMATDVETDTTHLVDGGMLQRIHMHKENSVPGSPGMPFGEWESTRSEADVTDEETPPRGA